MGELKWIDTHSHYNSRPFTKEESDIINGLKETTDKAITLGTNTKTNTETLRLISLYNNLWGMIGFFPSDVWELEEKFCKDACDNWLIFTKQMKNQRIVGVGEIGLDYHWDCLSAGKNKVFCMGEDARTIQKKWFIRQIDYADELGLPVSMHSRDAEEDTLRIFENYNKINGVMHCFSYGMRSAKEYLKKDLYIGVGGTSTYPSNTELREVIKFYPLNRILLETDAPYLPPQPVRRKMPNISSNIRYVVENIANIKGISCDEVIETTNKNAYELFKFQER